MNIRKEIEKLDALNKKIEEYTKKNERENEAIRALEYSKVILDNEIDKRKDQILKNNHIIKQAEHELDSTN